MDVNWHWQPAPPAEPGCTPFNGYSWDHSLFPDAVGYV